MAGNISFECREGFKGFIQKQDKYFLNKIRGHEAFLLIPNSTPIPIGKFSIKGRKFFLLNKNIQHGSGTWKKSSYQKFTFIQSFTLNHGLYYDYELLHYIGIIFQIDLVFLSYTENLSDCFQKDIYPITLNNFNYCKEHLSFDFSNIRKSPLTKNNYMIYYR